ncbi:MAG: hypothetical protein ACI9NN_001856 [Bacteroidia bacterium]|jgi:hypothetical protein
MEGFAFQYPINTAASLLYTVAYICSNPFLAVKMKNITAIIFCLFSFSSLAQNKFELGVNLDDNGAFVNLINHTNRYSNATGYDSFGWPSSNFDLVLLDGRPATEWTSSIDDPEEYRVDYSGRYAASFNGQADMSASGTSVSLENKNYDANTNITTFEIVVGGFPNANHGLVFLNFTNTRRTTGSALSSGITQLKVNRPGYPLSSNKTFTDEFISLCKAVDFDCYRFYNLQNIWNGEPTYPATTQWQNRKTKNDATQTSMSSTTGKRDAWCWEYIVELSNILNKDIWINIHTSADSNYVVGLANYLKNNLNPSINIYVENSNEVWSPSQATHGPYNAAQASFYGITFDQNYARRTVDLSNWFGSVFGVSEINKGIRVILAGQQGYHGRSDNHLNYINNTFGAPKNFIYANSTTVYFGSTEASSTDPDLINDGMMTEINDQISNASNALHRNNHINKAKTWDLPGGCTSYEGGPHLPAGGGTANLDNQIRSHRTPKMNSVLKLNYEAGWKDLGGGLAMYFTLSSAYNRYGCWGLTDDYTNPERNYKMKALREIQSANIGIPPLEKRRSLLLYPNPADDLIRVTAILPENQTGFSVEIYSSIGERVLAVESKNNGPINVAGLNSGLYFLHVDGAVVWFVKK